jgi:hypothetical protein
LKDANRREPGKRLHILVMNDGGFTRRLSVSVSFLWIMATLVILTLFSLGVLAWMVSSLLVDHKNLQNELGFLKSYAETREYNKSLDSAPEDARLILERLDRAALNAEEDEDDLALPRAVDDPGEAAGPGESASKAQGGNPGANPGTNPGSNPGSNPGQNPGQNPGSAPEGSPSESSSEGSGDLEGEGDQAEDAAFDLSGDSSKEGGESGTGEGSQVGAQAAAEAAAWASLHNRLSLPGEEKLLDVDEFKFSPRGSYSFYLQQIKSPGTRLKGRALTVFAMEDEKGKVALVSDPPIDLSKPFQGFEKGGRYNIVSSKVFKGNVRVPAGGKALSAEVLAWDEETKELIFIKKISLRGF